MSDENNELIDEDRQRTNQLIEMYRIQIEQWNKRRDVEWRFALAFWTGVVVATGFLADKIELSYWTLVLYLIALICYVYLWLYGLWSANDRDKREADTYKSAIEATLYIKSDCNHDKRPESQREQFKRFLTDWSMRAQIFFTGAILLASWYALYKIPKSESILAAFIDEVQKFLKTQ